ncbi:hypothetical protein BZG36_01517 [Bifiguratus adelaidae]|uniref:Uncharacterized protein n=1 Tax=Bifiguratus adelaidae TaxID=1938954 RepID=A0A261Y5B2_9FUNG|nr:hypothetical protein BZG36_01517 [Bifiguratus adelaidae]
MLAAISSMHASSGIPEVETSTFKDVTPAKEVAGASAKKNDKGALTDLFIEELLQISSLPQSDNVESDSDEAEKAALWEEILAVRSDVHDLEVELENMKNADMMMADKDSDGPSVELDQVIDHLTRLNTASDDLTHASTHKLYNDPNMRLLAAFSALVFTETHSVVETIDEVLYRHYDLHARARDLPFRVQFTVKEASLSVRHLALMVPEDVHPALAAFITDVERDCNLMAAFRGIIGFATERSRQRHLAQELQNSFGAHLGISESMAKAREGVDKRKSLNVVAAEEHTLTFRDKDGVVSQLTTYIDMDSYGACQLVARFGATLPEHWNTSAKTRIILELPDRFTTLASMYGVLDAAKIIVSALYTL